MRCRTHIVASNALSLICLAPSTPKELALTMVSATIGGAICDLDIRTSEVHKLIDTLTSIVFILLVTLYIYDYKKSIGIFSTLKNGIYYKPLIGLIIFLTLSLYGSHKPHRSFMHSLLGCFLFTITTYLCFGIVWMPFLIGMLSHIVLDFFNKKGIRLFYPIKTSYCMSLCDSDGLIDKLIFLISITIIIAILFLL